jgi:tetratricopeptide (TPR) repeat protein
MNDESNIQIENYTKNLHYFEQKIQQNQNDSISLFGQGMCLSALNRNNEAIDSYKAALSHIQPHDSLTYYIKGTLHY